MSLSFSFPTDSLFLFSNCLSLCHCFALSSVSTAPRVVLKPSNGMSTFAPSAEALSIDCGSLLNRAVVRSGNALPHRFWWGHARHNDQPHPGNGTEGLACTLRALLVSSFLSNLMAVLLTLPPASHLWCTPLFLRSYGAFEHKVCAMPPIPLDR